MPNPRKSLPPIVVHISYFGYDRAQGRRERTAKDSHQVFGMKIERSFLYRPLTRRLHLYRSNIGVGGWTKHYFIAIEKLTNLILPKYTFQKWTAFISLSHVVIIKPLLRGSVWADRLCFVSKRTFFWIKIEHFFCS